MACRTTISPEAYQPLSTLEMKKQLSKAGVVSLQSPWPGLVSTLPLVVSYHWYRKPLSRFRCVTSVRVAWILARACGSLTRPRSRAATTAHR